jgi:hypothetical protein
MWKASKVLWTCLSSEMVFYSLTLLTRVTRLLHAMNQFLVKHVSQCAAAVVFASKKLPVSPRPANPPVV